MSLIFPITFSLAPLATGQSLDANAYGQALIANLQASITGSFLTGQIEGVQPTQNVGPWLHNGHWWFWDPMSLTYVQESLTSTFPTGTILAFGGTVAPTGFVLCDGALYLRTGAMAALFSVIGTFYGAGDGSSTFQVPDGRGRTFIGAGNGVGLTARTLGTKVGEENHLLITSEMPAHLHGVTDAGHIHTATTTDSGHQHGITDLVHAHNISSQDPGHIHSISSQDPGHIHNISSQDPGHIHNVSSADPGHIHAVTDTHSHAYIGPNTGVQSLFGVTGGLSVVPVVSETGGTNSGSITVNTHTTGIINTAGSVTLIPNTAQATTGISTTAQHVTGIVNSAGSGTGLSITNVGHAASTTTVANHSTGITTTNTGGGGVHQNMQPSLVSAWIIKI